MEGALADFFAREASALRGEVKEKAKRNGGASLTKEQTDRVLRTLRTAMELTDGDPNDVVDVELTAIGGKKIQVIKAIREVTDFGLKEAKDAADRAPLIIAEDVDPRDADAMKERLEGQGATVTYK